LASWEYHIVVHGLGGCSGRRAAPWCCSGAFPASGAERQPVPLEACCQETGSTAGPLIDSVPRSNVVVAPMWRLTRVNASARTRYATARPRKIGTETPSAGSTNAAITAATTIEALKIMSYSTKTRPL